MSLRNVLLLFVIAATGATALVAVWVTNSYVADELTSQALAKLDGLSANARNRIQESNEHLADSVRLIASRTRLRVMLSEWQTSADPASEATILRILDDARDSVDQLLGIAIYGLDGDLVVTTGAAPVRREAFEIDDVALDLRREQGALLLDAWTPLWLEGERVGALATVWDGSYITNLTSDYAGLGESGEWLFAVRGDNGDAVFAVPLKYDPDAALRRVVPRDRVDVPITQALLGNEILMVDAPDYREVPVFAATRYIPAQNWGLVVKIDSSEVLEVVDRASAFLLALGGVLIAVSGLGGFLIAQAIARPVERLTGLTREIRDGDLTVRAPEEGWTEARELSQSFNAMADEMQSLMDNLNHHVRERTQELQAAHDELKRLAITDALTGLHNRRHLTDKLLEEVAVAGRYKVGLSVILLDLDHFKKVNDTYGHEAGDCVLRAVATCLRAAVRGTDTVGRFGGEEFCLILSHTELPDAMLLAERVRKAIANLESATPAGPLSVTCSLGLAAYREGLETPDAILAAADEALYAAKHGGRNQWIAAES